MRLQFLSIILASAFDASLSDSAPRALVLRGGGRGREDSAANISSACRVCNLCGSRVAGEWRAFFCKTCTHGQKEDGVVVLKEGEELVVMVRLAPETVHVEARVQVMVLRVCNRSGCSTGVLSGSPQRFVAMSLLVRPSEPCDFVKVKGRCLDCYRRSTHGPPDGESVFCSNHKIEGYVARRTTSSAKAEHLQKVKRRGVKDPLATQPGDQDPLATAAGAFPRLEKRDIWNYARCRHLEGCMRQPTYGDPAGGKPLYCSEHRLLTHKDIRNKQCLHEACSRRPSFGTVSGAAALYCSKHKPTGYRDVKNACCQVEAGCQQRARWGEAQARTLLSCSKHKQEDHVFVR